MQGKEKVYSMDNKKNVNYENKAHYLLADRGFDAEKLNNQLSEIELQTAYEPTETLGETDIESYLQHHHNMIVLTAIEESILSTKKSCDAVMMNALSSDWELSKNRLMDKMGRVRGSFQGSEYTQKEKKVEDAASPYVPRLQSGMPNVMHFSGNKVPQMSGKMKQYAEIVRKDLKNTNDLVKKFIHVEESFSSATVVTDSAVDFLSCWELLQHMLHQNGNFHDATFASVRTRMYAEEYLVNTNSLQRHFAQGAVTYLEGQFKHFLLRSVASASNNMQQIGGTTGLLHVVKEFVQLNIAKPYTDLDVWQDKPLWPMVFLCIRAGGYAEARDLLKQAAESTGLGQIVQDVLQIVQFELSSRWDARSPEIHASIKRIKQSLSTAKDRYYLVVCNLLVLGSPDHVEPLAIGAIEDFLWQRLCFCGTQQHEYTVTTLAENMLQFGSKHFDQDGTCSIVYFQILLLIQEFERAIEYIISSGFQFEGVHFAIVLDQYGALLVDDGNVSSSSPGLLLYTGDDGIPMEKPMLKFTSLLKHYIHLFSSSNTKQAIDYIFVLREEQEQYDLLMQLLLDTRSFTVLGGRLLPDGSFDEGMLHNYLNPSKVNHVVSSAAHSARSNGRPMDAVEMYQIVGDFENAINVFNSQLSQNISPSDPNRELWKQKATEFTNTYLSQSWARERITSVLVGQTFQTLLNLSVFFDLHHQSKWSEAMEFLEQLHLLPISTHGEFHRDSSMSIFMNLQDTVVVIFHKVLVAYMTCISQLYRSSKSQVHQTGSAEYRELLLRKANVVITFAGMIQYRLPDGTNEKLSRLEASMM